MIVVVWTVLMILALVGTGYSTWDRDRPQAFGSWALLWACVLILGLVLFGAVSVGPAPLR